MSQHCDDHDKGWWWKLLAMAAFLVVAQLYMNWLHENRFWFFALLGVSGACMVGVLVSAVRLGSEEALSAILLLIWALLAAFSYYTIDPECPWIRRPLEGAYWLSQAATTPHEKEGSDVAGLFALIWVSLCSWAVFIATVAPPAVLLCEAGHWMFERYARLVRSKLDGFIRVSGTWALSSAWILASVFAVPPCPLRACLDPEARFD